MERVHGRDIFHSGVLFCKTHEKNCVAQGKFCKDKNLKDLKIFQEKYLIAHGEGLLSTNLTREIQTHDTALRMCVHITDMLFRLAYSSGGQQTHQYKLAHRKKTTQHTSRRNARLLGALSRRW